MSYHEVYQSVTRENRLLKKKIEDLGETLNKVKLFTNQDRDELFQICRELAEIINLPLSYYEEESDQ